MRDDDRSFYVLLAIVSTLAFICLAVLVRLGVL